MSARSPAARRRDSSGHIDPQFARRKRYESVLRALNLWEPFAAMPRRMQEIFWQRKLPDPQLEVEPSVPFDREGRALRKKLEADWRAAGFCFAADAADAQWAAGQMHSRDFLSVVVGLLVLVRELKELDGGPGLAQTIRFVKAATPRLERFYEQCMPLAFAPLYHALHGTLVAHSRLERRVFTERFEHEPNIAGRIAARAIVAAFEPQVRSIILDGAARPMYRAARMSGTTDGTVNWLSWDGAQFGGTAGKEYPLYVQSHALRQLQQRVNLPPAMPYLQTWLGESLAEPNIVERQGENLLVEYRIKEYRIGYLVVTPLSDAVAVRTFLFLTMESTPESKMLRERLRLTRRDVDWLGLCDLAAFTQTDLRDDPVLRPMLERCGCGHLFALAEDGNVAYVPQVQPLAAQMRRYLRMAA
jgi:hypothetical protein